MQTLENKDVRGEQNDVKKFLTNIKFEQKFNTICGKARTNRNPLPISKNININGKHDKNRFINVKRKRASVLSTDRNHWNINENNEFEKQKLVMIVYMKE